MFRLLLTAALSKTCKRAHLPTTVLKLRQGMAQLESNCALYALTLKSELDRMQTLRLRLSLPLWLIYLNMCYGYRARYIINIDANRDIFAQVKCT